MRMNISEHAICDPPTQVKVRHRRLVAVSQPQSNLKTPWGLQRLIINHG